MLASISSMAADDCATLSLWWSTWPESLPMLPLICSIVALVLVTLALWFNTRPLMLWRW
jgi:hypothetical protein